MAADPKRPRPIDPPSLPPWLSRDDLPSAHGAKPPTFDDAKATPEVTARALAPIDPPPGPPTTPDTAPMRERANSKADGPVPAPPQPPSVSTRPAVRPARPSRRSRTSTTDPGRRVAKVPEPAPPEPDPEPETVRREVAAAAPLEPEPPTMKPAGAAAPEPPSEDPRALAERLARDAKARIAAQKVAEAKARLAARTGDGADEDPKVRAARVDAETAALQQPQVRKPAPEAASPAPEVPPAVGPAAAPADASPPAEAIAPSPPDETDADDASEPSPPKKGRLAARARKAKRPMSAKEALQAAVESTPAPAPRRSEGTPAPAPRRSDARATPAPAPRAEAPVKPWETPGPGPRRPPVPRAASPRATPAPAPAAPNPAEIAKAVAMIASLLPSGTLQGHPLPVRDRDTFRTVWNAHRAAALAEQDPQLVATASILLDAVDRVPDGKLLVAQVLLGDASWAAWLDTDRRVLLALATPGDVYLAGT